MRKLKLNLKKADEILTREQLKKVVGGNGSTAGQCTVEVECRGGNKISCTGSGGNCEYQDDAFLQVGWVQCDDDPSIQCNR